MSTKGLPRYYVVRETLRREIVESMKPGDKLPTEPELMKRMGVSRITVRHALDQLKADGLITTAQGRGTFVAHPSVRPNLLGLSSFLNDISASGQKPDTNVIRVGPSPAGSEAHNRLGLPPAVKLMCVEKIRLADEDPISYETTYILADIARHWTKRLLKETPLFDVLASQGVRLSWASVDVGAALAGGAIAKGLRVRNGSALLRVERVVHDHQDRAIEYDVLIYRADRVMYSFEARSGTVNPNLDAKAGFKLILDEVTS